jgi:hypothetical protein
LEHQPHQIGSPLCQVLCRFVGLVAQLPRYLLNVQLLRLTDRTSRTLAVIENA